MIFEKTFAAAYSSPRIEVLEMGPCDPLLQGSVPLDSGTPGSDLVPGGDYTL